MSGSLVGKDYSPDYNFGYKSGGGALGFAASNDISFELEAVSSSVIKPVNGQEVFCHLRNPISASLLFMISLMLAI